MSNRVGVCRHDIKLDSNFHVRISKKAGQFVMTKDHIIYCWKMMTIDVIVDVSIKTGEDIFKLAIKTREFVGFELKGQIVIEFRKSEYPLLPIHITRFLCNFFDVTPEDKYIFVIASLTNRYGSFTNEKMTFADVKKHMLHKSCFIRN